MGGIKTKYSFDLNADQMSWLQEMTKKYGISDEGKAVRIILEYIRDEVDLDAVFDEVRCNHCG